MPVGPPECPAHRHPVGVDDDVVQPLSRLERGADRRHPLLQPGPTRTLSGERHVVLVIFDRQLVEGVQVPCAHDISEQRQDGGPVSLACHRRAAAVSDMLSRPRDEV